MWRSTKSSEGAEDDGRMDHGDKEAMAGANGVANVESPADGVADVESPATPEEDSSALWI